MGRGTWMAGVVAVVVTGCHLLLPLDRAPLAKPSPPSPPSPPPAPAPECAYSSGNNYRQCGDCGWQFCLPSGQWSTDCVPNEQAFPCADGLVCGDDAICQ